MRSQLQMSEEDRLAVAWIRRMAKGDASALDALYQAYQPALLAFFMTILGDRLDAEEVLQDTFVRAYSHAGRFDSKLGSPFSWLATIGKRLCVDRLRRRQARPDLRPSHSQSFSEEQSGLPLDHIPHEKGHSDRIATDDWVHTLLSHLPEPQRSAVRMAFLEGQSLQDIARSLQRPLGTIKSDLHRGLMALKNFSSRLH